jgi:hypothetical protein
MFRLAPPVPRVFIIQASFETPAPQAPRDEGMPAPFHLCSSSRGISARQLLTHGAGQGSRRREFFMKTECVLYLFLRARSAQFGAALSSEAPNCQVLRQQEPTPATCPSRISSARTASPSSVILAAPKAMMRVVPSSSGTKVKLPLGTGPLNSQSLGMSSDHVQIAAVWFGTSRPFIMTGPASLTTRLPVPFETSAHVHIALPPPYTVTAQDRGFEKS